MQGDRARWIEQVATFPERLAALVGPLDEAQRTTRTAAEGWTVAQVVHHVADSHMNSYIRCKLIATEEHPALKPYDQEAWAHLPDATGASLDDTLALLRGLHARWATFWRTLPDDGWPRSGHHPEIGTVTLADQLPRYAAHGEEHLAQIERIVAALPA